MMTEVAQKTLAGLGWPSMEPSSLVPFGLGKQLGYLCILGAAAPERTRAGGLFEVPLVVQ